MRVNPRIALGIVQMREEAGSDGSWSTANDRSSLTIDRALMEATQQAAENRMAELRAAEERKEFLASPLANSW